MKHAQRKRPPYETLWHNVAVKPLVEYQRVQMKRWSGTLTWRDSADAAERSRTFFQIIIVNCPTKPRSMNTLQR